MWIMVEPVAEILFGIHQSLTRCYGCNNSLDYATGGVLSQQSSDDLKWHPIAFYSKLLNAVE
jgi:hypothetical protein